MEKIYCVYKGDQFISVGSLKDLSKELNIKIESLRWMSTPSALKRSNGHKLEVYLVQDERDSNNDKIY